MELLESPLNSLYSWCFIGNELFVTCRAASGNRPTCYVSSLVSTRNVRSLGPASLVAGLAVLKTRMPLCLSVGVLGQ